ncbi:MAG: ABC transporter substrate-binding protein [Roseitalea sp.]|jgi:iron complex transport system substrate-binding protein|nr:ABC transporter substrate-binding protein [Roseitalea sp.]MBO6722380.1 ABC transporter substrate-binding protein [Roseitalea sp.]MBO6744383.1 ABC transporter substrate-binding protein [Roseitalea sp.]
MKRLLTALALSLAAAPAMAFPVTVDSCGTPVTFEAPPERMVVHDINMADMAFALGLQDRMVGVTGITGWYKTSAEFDERRGDIPELAPKYPTMENLVGASPDLFFAGWYYGMKPGGDVTPDTLSAQGIKTIILSESCIHLDKDRPAASMDLLYADTLRLGAIFDKEAEAQALVDGWKSKLETIRQSVPEGEPTRVFLYDSGNDQPFTAGKYAITNAMIEAAGGVNVTGDMETSWGRTSWEAVAAANPQFLILLDYQGGDGAQGLLSFLKDHPVMSLTDAVKNERFVPLRYEELTPGPANIDAIEKIARTMHAGSS